MDDQLNYKRFYEHFGLELRSSGQQWGGACPFCGKPTGHFYVRKEDGQYICHHCGVTGNAYKFLETLHKESIKQTTDRHYSDLAENRGLLVSTLVEAQLAVSYLNGNWLIPTKNEFKKVTNLYQGIAYVAETAKLVIPKSSPPIGSPPIGPVGNQPSGWQGNHSPSTSGSSMGNNYPGLLNPLPPIQAYGTPSLSKYEIKSAYAPCQQQLYGIDLIDSQDLIIICEGHWDRLAVWEMLAHIPDGSMQKSRLFEPGFEFHVRGLPNYYNSVLQFVAVLGVPGANIFKPEWTKFLRSKHVILLYDNDPDRVICPDCRGKDGYKAHPLNTNCPICGTSKTTGNIVNPGRDGVNKVLKELSETGVSAKSLRKIDWRNGDPKDIRDCLCLHV